MVICDFGLTVEGTQPCAQQPDVLGQAPDLEQRFASSSNEVAGTLVYMSPEQALAEPLSAASDWYSAGVMLYQALTGRLPFSRALDYDDAVDAKLNERPPHPAELCPSVSPALAELALALLDPDPLHRAGYAQAWQALGSRPSQRPDRARARGHAFIGRDGAARGSCSARSTASRSEHATHRAGLGRFGHGQVGAGASTSSSRSKPTRGALVLRARCYEREELPYKALDPLIDALSSHL